MGQSVGGSCVSSQRLVGSPEPWCAPCSRARDDGSNWGPSPANRSAARIAIALAVAGANEHVLEEAILAGKVAGLSADELEHARLAAGRASIRRQRSYTLRDVDTSPTSPACHGFTSTAPADVRWHELRPRVCAKDGLDRVFPGSSSEDSQRSETLQWAHPEPLCVVDCGGGPASDTEDVVEETDRRTGHFITSDDGYEVGDAQPTALERRLRWATQRQDIVELEKAIMEAESRGFRRAQQQERVAYAEASFALRSLQARKFASRKR